MLIQKYTKDVLAEENQRQALTQADEMAAAVSRQIAFDRAYYTKNVIGKLKKEWDGFKASAEFHNVDTAIPLPATFVREVAESIDRESRYHYELLSKYNINPAQGLDDAFEQDACDATSQDEVGQLAKALNGMCQRLCTMVKDISTSASSLNKASGQISVTAAQLSNGAAW
jgi:methyl-accepting chemotaxis protein